jgi:50S ribosomal protein L16 3-hydroxylase
MDISHPNPLLGGLSPEVFMRRHWQKKPLLVRQAVPGGYLPMSRAALFDLTSFDEVESRLIVRQGARWSLRRGPFKRSALPPLKQREWTLLVQGADLHVPRARALLDRFRFVPDARVDDLMISYASDGGGVGPHVDSYDVFLLQARGRRHWHIGPVASPRLVSGVPLKILADFAPAQSFVLDAGDMLYLPPGWGHDGVAEGECMTCSIGFRAAGRDEIGRDVMQRLLDAADAEQVGPLYRDPKQPATDAPGRIPPALQAFACESAARLLRDPAALACALGEVLSEPKRGVWFDAEAGSGAAESGPLVLDQRTRMLYDERHVFINGESFRASGSDARAMRRLADQRFLTPRELGTLSAEAQELLGDWLAAGWVRAGEAH